MEKKNEQATGGISFNRLLPFLSLSFKRELAKDIHLVKECFVLHSDTAYKTLHNVIKQDVYKSKDEVIYRREPVWKKFLNIFKKA